jgi:hypothetical protein
MILSCLLLLSAVPAVVSEPPTPPSALEISIEPEWKEQIFHSLLDPSLYFGTGAVFGAATALSGIGWGVFQLTPWAETLGNECLITSQIFGTAAIHCLAQSIKKTPLLSFLFEKVPPSDTSWKINEKLLSQVSASSPAEKQLVHFLKARWLAKMTGCYPFLVDRMCDTFGIPVQVHPETTNSYARDPATKFSDTYRNRMVEWKKILPHPEEFPLILTRPSNVLPYLPLSIEMSEGETIQHCVARALALNHPDSPIVIDLTSLLPKDGKKSWIDAWQRYETEFCACSAECSKWIFLQRVNQKEIGGLRLLPLSSSRKEKIEEDHQFLLEWISRFGLSATRVELDRLFLPHSLSEQQNIDPIPLDPREKWVSFFNQTNQNWKSAHPQKTLMFMGTLQVLTDLFTAVSEEKWNEMRSLLTQSSIAQLSLTKIKQQLDSLIKRGETITFHKFVSQLEQVHADMTSLLEIFSPFTSEDFFGAFQLHQTTIPNDLKLLTRYALHASAMTSLAGIFKTVQNSLGRPPRILYGENTYFECIHATERISQASSTKEASEQDWKDVDLILAQFNPTVKRINFKVTDYQATEYHVEKIADTVHRALKGREGRPLSVALDCTLDFNDSPRVGTLLAEFQQEIESGDLNIMCYRSGLKFDLFGMDNYCGAPFFMLHSKDPKWNDFDPLLTDPVLQTDRLSINWFSLAYQHAVPYLEMYRKQVFANTRAVLNKIPSALYSPKNRNYRVIPVDQDVDPTFIDIKIFGPMHTFRGEMLVGIFLTIKCMEAGYPLLFRPGIGFSHPNLAVLFGKECTTVRLTVGLDPAQVDVIVRCLEKISACNGS